MTAAQAETQNICAGALGPRHHGPYRRRRQTQPPPRILCLPPRPPPAAVACALSEAASQGYRCAVTGDGADELLGGYSFTHALEPTAWAAHRAHMARVMEFGSTRIGAHLGMFVVSPYTQPGVKQAALRMSKADCVQAGVAGGRVPG